MTISGPACEPLARPRRVARSQVHLPEAAAATRSWR